MVILRIPITLLETRVVEIKHAHEVANRRAVERHVGVVFAGNRVGQIVAATLGKRVETNPAKPSVPP